MIDCVEAFDAAAAAAAERTVEAKFFLTESQSSRISKEKTATASSNTFTSAAAALFSTASLASSHSSFPTNIPAARSSPAAATHAAGSKKITQRFLMETTKEVSWQQKNKEAYGGGEPEGKADKNAGYELLSHPVHHLPPAGKLDAAASTATPSVFSPCPSEDVASPLMEASSCFPAGDFTSDDTAPQWDAASSSSTTTSSTQSSSRCSGRMAETQSGSREYSRNKTKKIEDAHTALGSPIAAALDSPAKISRKQLCTSSRRPSQLGDCYHFEDCTSSAAQDCWQQPSLFHQQAAVAQKTVSASINAVLPGEATAGCSSSNSMRCRWDGPAPLEGGRTAATLDYYLGDETCTPATDSCTPTEAFASEQHRGQRQEIEETYQIEDELLDEQQQLRMEKQQTAQKQELLQRRLQQVKLHGDGSPEWENDASADEDGRTPAAAEQDSLLGLQVRTIAAEEEEEDEETDEEEKAGPPPLLLFPFLRKAKVLKIAINEALLLQQQTSYLLQLHPPSSPTAVPAAFCSSCNGGSSALERTLLFESTKEEGAAGTEGAAAFTDAALAGDKGTMSLCYTCELALHVNTAQQLLTRTHRALQQLLLQQEEEEARWDEIQQQQQQPSMTLFLEQMQQQHETAASAAELRIRRSVLRQQQHQLQIALEQQQQLEDDLKARWETEVLADMQILCPDRPQQELQQKLSQQLLATEEQQGNAAAAAWLLVESSNCSTTQSCVPVDAESSVSTTTTTGGGGLQAAEVVAAKCRQLQKLQASLLEVRSMMEQMQQLQIGRDEQIGCIEEAAIVTKQNTSDAVHDLLLARKYQRRAFRHSLYFVGALAALFLFFFFPTSPLVPLLFLFHGERPPPSQSS